MTFHPYYEGQVQTCPYHSEIGTKGWFKLKEYLDARKLNGQPVTEEVIWEWMQAAAKAMAMVTTAIYDLVGYEHCLTRHSRKAEVDLFINAVNKEMRERKVDGRMEIGNINSALENLRGSIAAVLARNGLKEETDRRQKLSEVFARAPRPTGRVAPLQPLRQAI